MLTFATIASFVTGAALSAAASWFYYTHKVAKRVEGAVADVKKDVGDVSRKVSAVSAAVKA